MLGLLRKDWFVYKTKTKPYVLIIDILTFIGCLCFQHGIGLIAYTLVILPLAISTLLVGLFESDTKAKFNRYAITFPFTRKELVKSRFIFSLLVTLCYTIISTCFTILYYFIYNYSAFENHMLIGYSGLLISLILLNLNIVGCYLFGYTGGGVVLCVCMMGMGGIFSLLNFAFKIDFLLLVTNYQVYIWILASIITILISFVCYKLSQWKFNRSQY